MILTKNATTIAAVLAVHLARHGVEAHGYLKSPRSRNYVASIDKVWSGGTADDPAPETCPHCLNIGGTEAQCGKVGDHNYDYPPNAIGEGVLSPVIQACYEEAGIIDVETVLTAHHKGHFEFKACPILPGEVPSQACFDENPLTFVSDKLYGAPPDPLYPERAYIPRVDYPGGLAGYSSNGEYHFHHEFKLPDGLRGDLVLIQWYYVTGNSCMDEGYDTYAWPDYFYPGNIPVCDVIPPDGRGVPEQFWNCAEVEIKVSNGCGTSSPDTALPTTMPIVSPIIMPTSPPSMGSTLVNATSMPSYQPSINPTTPPTKQKGDTTTTTSTAVNTRATVTTTTSTSTSTSSPNSICKAESVSCGPANPCANGSCCSQWGHCGISEDYCGECCQNGNCWESPPSSTVSPSASPSQSPTSAPASKLVLNDSLRCGFSELDAREHCKPVCSADSECDSGEFCFVVHANYCGSIPQRVYEDPVQSPAVTRCGVSESTARTFCGESCSSWEECSNPGESCIGVHANYCDSTYTEV